MGDCYYFKPGDYTRHSRYFPPRKEGSWAPGHPETRGNQKKINPPQQQRCLKEGPGTALSFFLGPLSTPLSSHPCPGTQLEGDYPQTCRLGDAHLAGARPAARRVHAGDSGGWAPRRCPCSTPQPGTGGTGLLHPTPGTGEHVKGLVDPRDSSWEPELLCAFTLEARPEAGGCLGPNAPPSV